MPKYRVHYKSGYCEHSEYSYRDVVDASKHRALRKFFAEIRSFLESPELEGNLPPDGAQVNPGGEYEWWEGDWFFVYRGIEEIDAEPCPLCSGRGEITAAVARRAQGYQ